MLEKFVVTEGYQRLSERKYKSKRVKNENV
jgi:hypothetical protein